MEVVALGTHGGGVPGPGGAGTGYLFRAEGTELLVDCGNGVLGHLAEEIGFADLDALVVTHWHFDHVSDLMALLLARTRSEPLAVHAPAGFGDRVRSWAETFSGSPDLYLDQMDLDEYGPDDRLEVGRLTVRPRPVDHGPPTFAMRVTDGEHVAVFSADSRPCDELVAAAEDADLLICEATFPADPEYDDLRSTHLSGREAGRVADEAGADRLVLTHLVHHIDPAAMIEEAASVYDGPVEVAREGTAYPV